LSDRTFHFITSLPRSGSTLLSAILSQNPRFSAGVTSPVASLVNAVITQVSAESEWSSRVSIEQRRALLHGLFDSFYIGCDAPVICDTNRGWSARLGTVLDLFPQAKILACVGNVGWVMDSLERLYQSNPCKNTKLFTSDAERNTVLTRVDTLGQRTRLVGAAWAGLKEAYYDEHGASMMVIDYDILAQRPVETVGLIYTFLGEDRYGHDLTDLKFAAPDYDEALGIAGMHTVRPAVTFENRQTVLPPDLFEQYSRLSFWNDPTGSRCSVLRVGEPG
jgi:sulfotransferase